MNPDLAALIAKSANPHIRELFGDGSGDGASTSSGGSGGGSHRRTHTVAGHFRESLEALMGVLRETDALFVRTIKPNHEKKPGLFEVRRPMHTLS